jgi:hypothetical protein
MYLKCVVKSLHIFLLDVFISMGHNWTSCSCNVMLSAFIYVEGMGGDLRVIIGHHVAVL